MSAIQNSAYILFDKTKHIDAKKIVQSFQMHLASENYVEYISK
jgi:hypothetical protein